MDASKCVTWLYQTFGKFRSEIPIGIRAGGNSAFFCLSRKDVKKGRDTNEHHYVPGAEIYVHSYNISMQRKNISRKTEVQRGDTPSLSVTASGWRESSQ